MLKVTHSGAYEAREQAKTLQEWFSTGAATKKIREGLGVFSLSRKRNGPVMLEATLQAHFKNDDAMFDSVLDGKVSVWCTNTGLNVKGSIPDLKVGNRGDINDVIDGWTTSSVKIQGETAYMLVVKDMSWNSQSYEAETSIQNMEKMAASDVVAAIQKAVSDVLKELKEKVQNAMKGYRDGTYEYTPRDTERRNGRVNPMVVIVPVDKAVDELEAIAIGLESLSADAHKMYKGKDLFGGDYDLDFDKAIAMAKKASGLLSNIKSGEVDASDPAQRKTLEQIVSDTTTLSGYLSGLWNELTSGEQSCESFFGTGKKLKPLNLAFSASDFEPDSYGETAYDIEEEGLKSFDMLKPCVKSFVKLLNHLESDYETLIDEIEEALDETTAIEPGSDQDTITYQVKYQKLADINITE